MEREGGMHQFSLLKERPYQFITFYAQMLSYISQDRVQCADTKWVVTGNSDVMLTALIRCKPHITASLAGN